MSERVRLMSETGTPMLDGVLSRYKRREYGRGEGLRAEEARERKRWEGGVGGGTRAPRGHDKRGEKPVQFVCFSAGGRSASRPFDKEGSAALFVGIGYMPWGARQRGMDEGVSV